jgi:hypothetical protein
MCHAVRVKLTDAETKAARKLYGIMVPVYASLALVMLAAVMLSSGQRPADGIAVAQHASQPALGGARAAD